MRSEYFERSAKRVLMLSAHTVQLDRRITAEAAALSQNGYAVTILSLPVTRPHHDLSPSVTLVMPREYSNTGGFGLSSRLRGGLARTLPESVYDGLRRIYRHIHPGDPLHMEFFLANVPEGPWHVIHCHDLDTLPAGIAIKDRLAPAARIIYDAHELFPYQVPGGSFQRRWLSLEAEAIARVDAVITINPAFADHMADSYGIDRPAVLYNSCLPAGTPDIGEREFLEHFGAPSDGFRVLFQGSMTAGRNLDSLVRAFSLLGPSARLFMLGGGEEERRLSARARRMRLGNVHFGAWTAQDRLLGFAAHAHMGVIPYDGSVLLNNRLATPNKLFEFLEAMLPVCSAELPEVAAIIEGSGIGHSYPMANATEIADAIEDCRRRSSAGEFTLSARRHAREAYAWERQSEVLLDVYDNVRNNACAE